MNPKSELLLIATLLLTTLAHVLDFVIMMPLGPKLMSDFNISAAYFGYLVSVYTLAAAFSSLLSSFWIDRVDRKAAMILLLSGFTIANGMCVWAPTEHYLMAGRLIAGLFGGVMNAVVYSIVGQVVSVARRGRAAGMMGIAFPLVSILGVPAGLRIADLYGWRMTFLLVLGVSIAAAIMALFTLPSVKPDQNEHDKNKLWAPIKGVIGYAPHWTGFALIVLGVFGGFIIVPYIAPFLIFNGYIEENMLYLIYLAGGLCSMISSRVIGVLADRYGKTKILSYTLIGSMLSLAFFTNLPHHSLGLVLVATSLTMVFIPGRFVSVMALITMISHPKYRGAYMSLVSALQQASIGVAAILGGMLVGEGTDGHLETYWAAGITAIAANGCIFLFLLKRLQKIERKALQV